MSTIHSQANAPSHARDATVPRAHDAPARGEPPATLESPSAVVLHAVSGPAWLEFIKRWSPACFPPVLGIFLLLVAWIFSTQSSTAGAPTVSPTVLIELLAIYIVLGMIWGISLYLATITLRWLLVIFGGIASYVVVTASVYWGIGGGIVLIVLLGALAMWYGRQRAHEVPAGATAVTTLAGAHFRTLPAGVWLLAPGERLRDTVEIHEQTLVVGPVEVHLQDEEGRPMIARAAAVIGFRVAHAAAHRVVLAPEDWAYDLHAIADAMLAQSLEEWARLPQSASNEHPADQLGTMYQRDLIERAGDLGIRGITIHMQEVALHHEGDQNPLDQSHRAPIIQAASLPPSAMSQASATAPLPTWANDSQALPSMRAAAPNEPAPPLPDALDPEVLTQAYQAIADRRITDPTTIRAIADAFTTIARDPARASSVDFDAESAARILIGHAAKLERKSKR